MMKNMTILFLGIIGLFLTGCAAEEMVERIRADIEFVEVDENTFFQLAQENAVSAIFLAKNGDKSIMATRENSNLQDNAIAIVRYKNFDQPGICVGVQQRKESQLTNCAFDENTKQMIVKMMIADNELWNMLTQQVQIT